MRGATAAPAANNHSPGRFRLIEAAAAAASSKTSNSPACVAARSRRERERVLVRPEVAQWATRVARSLARLAGLRSLGA